VANSRTPITGRPADPPRYGLIPTLGISEPAPARMVAGVEFQPEGCDAAGASAVECGSDTAAMDGGTGPGTIGQVPIWYWAEDRCSTFGFYSRDWEGRVRRALAAHRSYSVAAELWDGAISLAESYENPVLAGDWADVDVVTSGATAVGKALGCLEQALAFGLKGGEGLVHFTPQALVHLAELNSVRWDGTAWRTPMGHRVIADAGYSGNGPGETPAGTTQWAYATPMLDLFADQVALLPGDPTDREVLAQGAMDIALNTVAVRAGQLILVRWANECVLAAAELDLPVCAVGGDS